jgi:hypothetical protein
LLNQEELKDFYQEHHFLKPNEKKPKSSTFSHGCERGSQGKEQRMAHVYIPNQNRKGEASKPPNKNIQEKAPKIKKGKWERQQKAVRNHDEHSIHAKKDSYKV